MFGIILFVIGLMLCMILIALLRMYNSLVRLKNNIRKSWANIDVLLKQRSDELPNLIATVKGYMEHERTTLDLLTKARTDVLSAPTLSKKAAADSRITTALKTIFAVAERYPNLKANERFHQLQTRITVLENELADRREFYNDSVKIYNIRIHSIPDVLVARMMNYTDEPWFKASEKDMAVVPVRP
ncbi:MAG: LemA family protein [Candidatus Thermoplasmatota archaeon]|nr:LemA family protein [Candidatus Thermoplasmatota archaeon]